MGTKHTPQIALQAARADFRAAQQACPHWDYESDGCGHECCAELERAERQFYAARAAVED